MARKLATAGTLADPIRMNYNPKFKDFGIRMFTLIQRYYAEIINMSDDMGRLKYGMNGARPEGC